MNKKKKIAWGSAGIIAAGAITASLISAVAASGNDPQGSSIDGDGDGPRINHQGNGDIKYGEVEDSPSSDGFQENQPPAPTGPWTYRVVNTVTEVRDEGLKVRTCPLSDCPGPDSDTQIGLVLSRQIVWVECKKDTGFDGHEGVDNTTWMKVKWPTNKPHTKADLSSSREDKFTGWMFSEYLEPASHNGKIPTCL